MPKVRYLRGQLQGKPEWWGPVGWVQFGFLWDYGLRPGHTLLDLGCGTFRVGRMLIEYLETGHYYGIDRYQEALDIGIEKVLEPQELTIKEPHLLALRLTKESIDFESELGCAAIDYAWIHSLFVHIGPAAARRLILDLACILPEDGQIFSTAFINPAAINTESIRWNENPPHITTYPNKEYWHYSEGFFVDVAEEAGLEMDMINYAHPYPMKMIRWARNA